MQCPNWTNQHFLGESELLILSNLELIYVFLFNVVPSDFLSKSQLSFHIGSWQSATNMAEKRRSGPSREHGIMEYTLF